MVLLNKIAPIANALIIDNENKNINMFYILLDGMMSLELFSKYYEYNVDYIKKNKCQIY